MQFLDRMEVCLSAVIALSAMLFRSVVSRSCGAHEYSQIRIVACACVWIVRIITVYVLTHTITPQTVITQSPSMLHTDHSTMSLATHSEARNALSHVDLVSQRVLCWHADDSWKIPAGSQWCSVEFCYTDCKQPADKELA